MKRDEFMDKARQELDLIMTSRKNAIMNIIEQAWAEGKRNAELDEITDIVKRRWTERNRATRSRRPIPTRSARGSIRSSPVTRQGRSRPKHTSQTKRTSRTK